LKVTQLKQLDADLDRNRAICQVNCSIHLKNVAGGRNALAGYNRLARQPPMNSTEVVCGRDVAVKINQPIPVTVPAGTMTEVISNDST
jgi:hypothetical protein